MSWWSWLIIGIVIGANIGMFTYAAFGIGAYEKGRQDGIREAKELLEEDEDVNNSIQQK